MNNQTGIIKKFYNDIAVEYANEWYNNGSFYMILKSFVSLLQSSPMILDMGCGAGYHCMTLSSLGANVTGIDISENAIQIARTKNPDCHFEVMDFCNMSSDLGPFDGIISIATLWHIPDNDLPIIFSNIKAILRNCGYLMLVVNEGKGDGQSAFHGEVNGKQYDFYNYYHNLQRVNEIASKERLCMFDEWKLPEEHSSRGYKCYLYQLSK